MESHTEAPVRRHRRNSRWGERFTYGGVAFEVLGDPSFELGDEHLSVCAPVTDPACQIELRVAVTADPSLPIQGSAEATWRWDGDVATVRTDCVDAELLRLGPHRYAARARVRPSDGSGLSLVTALASAVVYREGGLVLRAAGIVLDDLGFLLIGPTEAETANVASQCRAGQWIAHDRAAVLPGCDGWVVWGLAGGDGIDLPQAEERSAPLSGVFRVRPGDANARVVDLSNAARVAVLREAVQDGRELDDLRPGDERLNEERVDDELSRLDAVRRLAAEARVGVLETLPGEPLDPTLRG